MIWSKHLDISLLLNCYVYIIGQVWVPRSLDQKVSENSSAQASVTALIRFVIFLVEGWVLYIYLNKLLHTCYST